jgi:hypothetical protein
MAGKKKKKKQQRPVPADHALVKLLPSLKEAERKVRAKFESVSGFQISRPREDEETFGELMEKLQAIEEQVVQMIDGLSQFEVGELVTWIIPLLDAGSVDFLAGTRRQEGLQVRTAARKALCRRDSWDDEEEEEEHSDGSSENGSSRSQDASPSTAKEPKKMTEKESQYTIGHLVAAYADAGLIVMRSQLWGPARDGDHLALTALLALDPWTVDEPGRVGEGFTSALQVACAGGHVECVEVLLKHRAIFRDKDWQSTPRPFVCASMLTGAGYYDGGKPPGGILHFQSSSLPKRRVARETYVYIIDRLLEEATFCEPGDREMLCNTRFAMLNVDPPPLVEGSGTLVCPPYTPPLPPPVPDAPRVAAATPRYMAGTGAHVGSAVGSAVAGATPRDGGVGRATPRGPGFNPLGRGVSPPMRGANVGGSTPREGRMSAGVGRVGHATPREGGGGVGHRTPREVTVSSGAVGSRTPRDLVSSATPRLGRGVSTPVVGGSASSPALLHSISASRVAAATPREASKVGGATPRHDVRGQLLQRNGPGPNVTSSPTVLGAAPGMPTFDKPPVVIANKGSGKVSSATPRDKAASRGVASGLNGLLIAR